ncbi:MAG TPA: PhnD/SsuA/transferrin family substrate-binding protein [Planktothrix sp.]|jgi:ABC-type phosphate/phosphonate transport system substrate-binding protein
MYDLPYIQQDNDVLWLEIATRLKEAGEEDVPLALTRTLPLKQVWEHPRLLLAQTCGYPLVTSLLNKVKLVATPRYNCQGCSGSSHSAAIIVRADDARARLAEFKGSHCVVNDITSNSGMNLLRNSIAPLANREKFFETVSETGSHAVSLEAVADSTADIAAIDCITFAHLRRAKRELCTAVRVLGWTESSPGLPLITASWTDDSSIALMRSILQEIMIDTSLKGVRQSLFLDGFDVLDLADYEPIGLMQRRAQDLGFPQLK